MDGQTWTVVQFLEDSLVEAIPSTWIQGNNCHWPSFAREKLYNAIRKSEPLNTCWPTHPIKIFRNATYGDYLTARNKARVAEDTSNLESEPEFQVKRKKIQKFLSSSDESLNSSFLPSPPKIKKNKTTEKIGVQKRPNQTEPGSLQKTDYSDIQKKQADEGHALEYEELEKESHAINQHLQEQDAIEIEEQQNFNNLGGLLKGQQLRQKFNKPQRNQEKSIQCSSCQCKKCLERDENLKRVIQQGHILRGLLSDTLAEVQAIRKELKKSANYYPEKETPGLSFYTNVGCKFPINSDEDLDTFETYLKQEENFKNAVRELKKLGGSNVYDFVRRSLKTIISNEIALKYSWLGRKGKKAFSSLSLATLIIESAKATIEGENQKSIETAIQLWIRRSFDRIKYMVNKSF